MFLTPCTTSGGPGLFPGGRKPPAGRPAGGFPPDRVPTDPAGGRTRPRSPLTGTAHQAPIRCHHAVPIVSQITMWTIPMTSPLRHQWPIVTYPVPKNSGAGPFP